MPTGQDVTSLVTGSCCFETCDIIFRDRNIQFDP